MFFLGTRNEWSGWFRFFFFFFHASGMMRLGMASSASIYFFSRSTYLSRFFLPSSLSISVIPNTFARLWGCERGVVWGKGARRQR